MTGRLKRQTPLFLCHISFNHYFCFDCLSVPSETWWRHFFLRVICLPSWSSLETSLRRCVCVCEQERESVYVCVRERERESVCVCVRIIIIMFCYMKSLVMWVSFNWSVGNSLHILVHSVLIIFNNNIIDHVTVMWCGRLILHNTNQLRISNTIKKKYLFIHVVLWRLGEKLRLYHCSHLCV